MYHSQPRTQRWTLVRLSWYRAIRDCPALAWESLLNPTPRAAMMCSLFIRQTGLVSRTTRGSQTAFRGPVQMFAYRHERTLSRTKVFCALHLGRIEIDCCSIYATVSIIVCVACFTGSGLLLGLRATTGCLSSLPLLHV